MLSKQSYYCTMISKKRQFPSQTLRNTDTQTHSITHSLHHQHTLARGRLHVDVVHAGASPSDHPQPPAVGQHLLCDARGRTYHSSVMFLRCKGIQTPLIEGRKEGGGGGGGGGWGVLQASGDFKEHQPEAVRHQSLVCVNI